MKEITNNFSTMAFEKKMGISSVDTAIITYPNGTQDIIKVHRPIFDRSQNFIEPEARYANGTHISWHSDGYIEVYKNDGTRIFWWEPPTIEDVVFGRLGKGVSAIFHTDGSIEMKRYNGIIWTWGVPFEMEMEDAYDAWEPPEPCDRCRLLDCGCGERDF